MPIKPTSLAERFWRFVRKSEDCWMWTGAKTNGGYGVIQEGRRPSKLIRAHRLSYEMHHGPFDKSLDVCHHCDNPACVRPDHLFLGTAKANVADMITKGRASKGRPPRGKKHHRAKLTDEQVRSIRSEYATGETSLMRLATRYQVSKRTILNVIHHRIWTHV